MAVTLAVSITQNSQSVANNTSNVTVKVTASWTYGSFNQLQKPGTCTINGIQYSFTSSFNENQATSGSKVIYSNTLNIAHNADGTKTLAASASYVTGVSSGTITASTSKALTTIPRASSVSVSPTSIDMGNDLTISISRASSSFTHTLTYSFGGETGTIGTGIATSKTWTVPLSLANKIPNSTWGTMTITCETYNGSTKIGSRITGFQVKVPASVVPTISAISTSDPTGFLATYGAYVQSRSTCKIDVSASGAYSSTISAYSIAANGQTYTSNGSTTGVLNSAGTNTISVTVTDTRGRTATSSTTINVLAYANPMLTTFDVNRCNSDGTLNEEGAYMKATIKASISPLNNLNTKTIKLEYQVQGASTWTTAATYSSYSVDTVEIIPANVDSPFLVRLTVTDSFTSGIKYVTVGTSFTLVDYHSSGKGIAFGKVAQEEYLFDCDLPAQFNKSLKKGSSEVAIDDSYVANEYINIYDVAIGGLITNDAKTAAFSVPIARRLSKISSASVTSLIAGIRTTSGNYLNEGSDTYEWVGQSDIEITARIDAETNTILVRIIKSSEYTDVINNTPLGIHINTLTFELA